MRTHERYFLKTSKVDNGPGYWKSTRCEIYRKEDDGTETRCGEYIRKYDGFTEDTFAPFSRDGKDYAIYSDDYTTWRVMSLPDCIDIGGREPSSHGFCPVEIYIPRFTFVKEHPPGEEVNWVFFEDSPEDINAEEKYDEYAPFAFVIGCVWGDDTSMKYQFIDLTDLSNPKDDDRFGYIWTPTTRGGRLPLQEQIRIWCENTSEEYADIHIHGHPYDLSFELATSLRFRYTGEVGHGCLPNVKAIKGHNDEFIKFVDEPKG